MLCILLHVYIETALPSQETFLDSWRPQNNRQSQYEESSHCMSQLEVQNEVSDLGFNVCNNFLF